MAKTVQQLSASDRGVWTVTTQTSTYVLDLDAGTLMRAPGLGSATASTPQPVPDPNLPADPHESQETWHVSQLRKDSTDIPLLSIGACRVGQPAEFWVKAADSDDVYTWRITTPVTKIERIG